MKFLEKVKNMFTEEVEEDIIPIKTEVRKVEITAPEKPKEKIEIPKEEKISDNETLKKEEKFKFPVYFDDNDFDNLPSARVGKREEVRPAPIPKPAPKPVIKQPVKPIPKEPVKKEAYGGKNPALSANIKKEEKKAFKPTPIISPVYGILDKNYKKEDITPKKKVPEIRSSKQMTVDDIRNKAFGSWEEDLETTLFGKDSIFNEDSKEMEIDDFDLFDELDIRVEEPRKKSQEKAVPSRAEKNKELELMDEVNELENLVINEKPEINKKDSKKIEETPENMIEEEMDKICNNTKKEEPELTDSDLFNLIDSMYEKKDGEE